MTTKHILLWAAGAAVSVEVTLNDQQLAAIAAAVTAAALAVWRFYVQNSNRP